jgi:hypothetical protein
MSRKLWVFSSRGVRQKVAAGRMLPRSPDFAPGTGTAEALHESCGPARRAFAANGELR